MGSNPESDRGLAVRQVAMVETHAVSKRAAPRPATPENDDDKFGEVNEELAALRAIVTAAAHSSRGLVWTIHVVRH
jgi:hypothetical protein